MNDTKKIQLGRRQGRMLSLLMAGSQSSSEIFTILKEKESVSLVTIKRELSSLLRSGFILKTGDGRSVTYALAARGLLLNPILASDFFKKDVDQRKGFSFINLDLFEGMNFDLFSEDETALLKDATLFYKKRVKGISLVLEHKEMERFVVELSWKSSKIEGNTYTLLDTENLLLYGIEAPGHSKDEAQMILNHKKAFRFIFDHKENFKNINKGKIEDVHKILAGALGVSNYIRKGPVGITGSLYKPLDNAHQITEALEKLSKLIRATLDPFAKALTALVFISYVQPFEDGNKRTARLVSNAILLAHGLVPLSYRSVDEKHYKESMLVFYETNSIVEMKKIFIEQYDFAARNYLL